MGVMASVSQNVVFYLGPASIVEGVMETTALNGFANGEMDGTVEQRDWAAMEEVPSGGDVNQYYSKHRSSGSSNILCDQVSIAASAKDYATDFTDRRKCELGTDHWFHLINQTEQLLERLKKLESSNGQDVQDWVSKCALEVDIRLSDMKSLAPHGSSLHPLWMHSEGQLKRLESAIDIKIGLLDKLITSVKEVESKNIYDTLIEECDSLEKTKPDLKADDKKNEDIPAPAAADDTVHSQNLGDSKHISSVNSPFRQSTGTESFSVAVVPDGSAHYSSEDVDMDVDMEVEEDMAPASQCGGGSTVNCNRAVSPNSC